MSVYKSISESVFRSVHPSTKVPLALLGGGAANPLSQILDGGTIWTDAISFKYYLKDQSTDNTHLPRQGRAWLFDGTNDAAALGANISNPGEYTITAWIKTTTVAAGVRAIVSNTDAAGSVVDYEFEINRTAGKLTAITNTGAAVVITSTASIVVNTWTHVVLVKSGATGNWTYKIYINGALDNTATSSLNANNSASSRFAVGRAGGYTGGAIGHFSGSIRDLRFYSSAKTAGEITAIYDQSRTGNGTFDTTGLLAAYPCNEESGTTGYDISGNGKHLTLTNITQATFHAADTGVTANRNNAEGYRLSGSDYIPKRLSDSLAADGNALTVTGRAAFHGCAETPCVTNHTGTVYIAAAHLTGSETVLSFSGSTTTPTISAGRIDWQSGQTLSDLTLSDGTRYTMQEGPGSGNTNRTVYNVNGSTNHGTLTNGTVATIWGTRLTGTAQDWCILYGGRIGAAGEFVPGRVSGSLAADGSAKTLVAGKFGNPFSRLNLNPATAAEFNGRSVPTAGEVGDLINGTIAPDDTGFNRVDTDGDDRFLIYEDTLTGSDLTNVEAYVS